MVGDAFSSINATNHNCHCRERIVIRKNMYSSDFLAKRTIIHLKYATSLKYFGSNCEEPFKYLISLMQIEKYEIHRSAIFTNLRLI